MKQIGFFILALVMILITAATSAQTIPARAGSGLNIGESCPAFGPIHISGPDAGTMACPMCKYGSGQGIIIWLNYTNLDGIKLFALAMEREMRLRGELKFRVFLVFMNPAHRREQTQQAATLRGKLQKWSVENNLHKVAVVWVSSSTDKTTSALYRINPAVTSTVLAYKKRIVTRKWIDMSFDQAAVRSILAEFN